MHELNSDFYKVLIEDRTREREKFFYDQHLAKLQRREKPAPERVAGRRARIRFTIFQRTICFLLRNDRDRKTSNAAK